MKEGLFTDMFRKVKFNNIRQINRLTLRAFYDATRRVTTLSTQAAELT